jgi:hypothetical protein
MYRKGDFHLFLDQSHVATYPLLNSYLLSEKILENSTKFVREIPVTNACVSCKGEKFRERNAQELKTLSVRTFCNGS